MSTCLVCLFPLSKVLLHFADSSLSKFERVFRVVCVCIFSTPLSTGLLHLLNLSRLSHFVISVGALALAVLKVSRSLAMGPAPICPLLLFLDISDVFRAVCSCLSCILFDWSAHPRQVLLFVKVCRLARIRCYAVSQVFPSFFDWFAPLSERPQVPCGHSQTMNTTGSEESIKHKPETRNENPAGPV